MDELAWAEGASVDDAPALLDALIDALPVSVLLFDCSGRWLAANRSYRDLMGRLPPPSFSILDDDVAAKRGMVPLFLRAAAGEHVRGPSFWYDPRERSELEPHAGRRMYLQISLVPIRRRSGEVGYVAMLLRDQTETQLDREQIERQRDELRGEVAERSAALGELRASEANLVTAQRINRIGSWSFDLVDLDVLERNPLRWSEEVYRIYGLDPDRVEPGVDAFVGLVHPDDRPRMGAALRDALATDGRYALDARIRRPDGAERIIHSEAIVERDGDGRPVRVLGTVQDVTEQRLADTLLRENEERLQMALTAGHMLAWEVDVATGRLFLSRNADEVLGLLPGQQVENLRDVAGLIDPDDLDAVSRALVTARNGDGLPDLAIRVTRPIDGRTIWIQGRSHPSRDPTAGPPTRIRGLAIDITEQKRLDDALRASEFGYRTLVERAPEAIVVLDIDAGHFVEANASALRMFGRSREELCRLAPHQVSPPTQPDGQPSLEAAFGYLAQALAGETPIFEWMHRDAAGRDIPCEIRLVRLPAEGRRLVRGSILDITAPKRLDEMRARSAELEVQNRRIREASRLKSEFLANMSHELRTPLNAIIGFAELLHDGQVPVDAPQFREFLGDILTSGRHLLQLINDVLDLSKIEAGKTEFRAEPIDIGRLIHEVVAILRTTASRRRVAVSVEVDPMLVDVRLDPARLKQILYNYLSNALKFTEPGGRVAVRARGEDGERLRLEVEDTGVGIAAADLGRLFVEFQQLDASQRQHGTGLGLALTRRLVEAQGGAVGVASTPGVGSTFSAVLPRRFGGEVTRRTRVTTGSPLDVSIRARRVLVVEGDPADQHRLAGILAAAGYDVAVAATAAEALGQSRELAFDAATIDLLPDTSGLDLIRSLRATPGGRDLPIIVVTGIADATPVAGFGVHDVLRKPVDPALLLEALARVGVAPAVTGAVVADGQRHRK